jgi:hypothetical protein
MEAALREWAALSAPSRALDPAMVLAHAHHADRLQRQLLAKRQALEELRASRDETLVRLAAAMREHEALQDHRQEQRTLFVAAQVSDECKAADDQWVSSQNRRRDVHQA